jgi:hypothetical protein
MYYRCNSSSGVAFRVMCVHFFLSRVKKKTRKSEVFEKKLLLLALPRLIVGIE